MVLFVFEGVRPEWSLFDSIDNLFLHIGAEKMVCAFQTNIYRLYNEICSYGIDVNEIDTVSVLKGWLNTKKDKTLDKYDSDSFSEIYLFFDYDPHAAISNNLSLNELNRQVKDMLELFSNETEHGKLYVSYPMSEAIRYTRQLPDADFWKYTCPINECSDFKNKSAKFSFYKNSDFVLYSRCKTSEEVAVVRGNWQVLLNQHAFKANYICNSTNSMPLSKDEVSQIKIFTEQQKQYVDPQNVISILSAFPLFMFDYLPREEVTCYE